MRLPVLAWFSMITVLAEGIVQTAPSKGSTTIMTASEIAKFWAAVSTKIKPLSPADREFALERLVLQLAQRVDDEKSAYSALEASVS